MIRIINKLEVFMRGNLSKAHHHHKQLSLLKKRQHVAVQLLQKWALNVIVQCKAHVYVMQPVGVVQIFVKNK
jgi:hypothetical protein